MSEKSRMVIALSLVCGLLTLLAAHPFLYERDDALIWVLGGLIAVSGVVVGAECFIRSAWRRRNAGPRASPGVWHRRLLSVSTAVFAAGILLSFSVNDQASLSGLVPAVFGLWSLGLGRQLGADEGAIGLLACATMGFGAVVAGYAIIQHLGLDPLPAATAFTDRTVAVFENPNHLGSFMAALLPVALGGFLLSSRLRFHFVWYPVTGLLYAALLLAGSRGAWVGCLAGLAVMLSSAAVQVRESGGRWSRGPVMVMVATLAAVSLWLGPTPVMENEHGAVTVGERILSTANAAAGTTEDRTLNHRYLLWKVAWQLILDRPVLGIGLGRFADHAATVAGMWERDGSRFAHNEYLNYWVEGGLLTLVGFLGVVVSTVLRSRRRGLWPVAAGVGASVLVHGLVSYPLHMPATAILFWVSLGIISTKRDNPVSQIEPR